ncbi:FG-GAP-like repeat-containing protein [Rhizosphaericola mali]|uniref:Teneurin-like YD-shell domain-containing protein n=1 Tax=Rhizosphaericola mali TaxID=2545455 RepID=A0A5P2G1V4_9BACT|nr:FG-GAP-like repeat-containing protein [Rhizosphaericola mali]QES88069.1 hypothetical protein E0W69_005115 [Rhizosphaericola mali]
MTLSIILICSNTAYAQTIDLSKPVGSSSSQGSVGPMAESQYTIPLKLLKGNGTFTPNITIDYNNHRGDGLAGWGWSISCLSSITRSGKTNYYNGLSSPISYTNTNDAFVLDGQHMFVTSGSNGADGSTYGLENEQFAKIQSTGGSETMGPTYFTVTQKDGTVFEYGNGNGFRFLTDAGTSTMIWLLDKVTDINGNYISYSYSIDQANRNYQLTEIDYGGNITKGTSHYSKILFTYSSKEGWQTNIQYYGGASIKNPYNLSQIAIKNASNQVVKTYGFSYRELREQYFLTSVTETGSGGIAINPLIFTYGSDTTDSNVMVSANYTTAFHPNNVYAGDYDGDGFQDLMNVNYSYDNNGIRHDLSYDVFNNFTSYGSTPAMGIIGSSNLPTNIIPQINASNNGYTNYLSNDYDGDGKQDIVMINNTASGSDLVYNGIKINFSRTLSVYSQLTHDSTIISSVPSSGGYGSFKYTYRNGTRFGHNFIAGDFDGDGYQDYILILGVNSSNEFKGFFSNPRSGVINAEIATFGVSGTTTDPFYANSIASASELIPIDFDGDGKQELFVVTPTQSYILSIYPISATSGYSYAAKILYTTTSITAPSVTPSSSSNYFVGNTIFPGDFNGDGKMDILSRAGYSDPSSTWNIYTSTGASFIATPFIWTNRPYLPQDGAGSAHHIVVGDINGDGRDDVWQAMDLSSSSSQNNAYFSNGQYFVRETYPTSGSVNGSTNLSDIIGDFNGDGKPDILALNTSTSVERFIFPRPLRDERNLISAIDGIGKQFNYNYALASSQSETFAGLVYSKSLPFLYGRTTSFSPNNPLLGISGNPYLVPTMNNYLVSYTTQSNGLTGSNNLNTTVYQYQDAIISQSRGFLGFRSVTATDQTSGIQQITMNSINNDLLILHPIHVSSVLNNDTLYDTKITDTLQLVTNNFGDKRYNYKILKNISYNGLTGAASETDNSYDNYGNITHNTLVTGSISLGTISPVEILDKSFGFGIHNTPVPAKPDIVTITNNRIGQSVFNKTSTFGYDALGNTISRVDFPSSSNTVTTSTTYDGFGNIIQTDISGTGASTRTTKYSYDNTGCFLTTRIIAGNGVNKTEQFSYDPTFGKVAQYTSSDGRITKYTYDGFANLVTIVVPDGYTISRTLGWESSTGRYSLNVTRPGGGSNVKSFYDILGRDVQQQITGFNNASLISATTYDSYGRTSATVAAHYSNETAVTTSYIYDAYSRPTNINNGSKSFAFGYSSNNGNYQVTRTKGSGQASSQTTDATGKVVSATDNGGTINYTYNSQGKLLQTNVNGSISSSFSYDPYGNRTSSNERNAGNYTYTYDGFGEILTQKDPLGHTTTLTYDDFGRLSTRVGNEGTSSYTYWSDPTTGFANDNIVSINGFGGDAKEYTYDINRRLSSEKVTVDGASYTTSYSYDMYGNTVQVTYPTGTTISRTFDNNGIVTQISKGAGSGATILFTATAMNSLGKYTAYSLGNGKSSAETYNLATGTPTQYVTNGIQNLNFTFDVQTGNLTERKDAIANLDETFTYDNLDRLTGVKLNNIQQQTLTYDGQSGSTLGNIASKTDAGNYTYQTDKVNAVAYITNPSGATAPPAVIPTTEQTITYTAFQKTATVSDNGYLETYTYGSDFQRIKSVLTQNGSILETKYYLGEYEKQIKGGVTNDIIYVSNGNGIFATLVGSAIYYTYKDYLGSLLTVTDGSGNVIASQNFDAWGRKRNPADGSYANIPSTNPVWLYRGYNGHEHLDELGLVNMNGRMYDPVQGRMMSPDIEITYPEYTQSYNGYSYALDNPLIMIDPTGYSFWSFLGKAGKTILTGAEDLGAMIGTGIVGYVGASLESGGHWNVSGWNHDWWKGALTSDLIAGAIAVDVMSFGGGSTILGAEIPTLTSVFGTTAAGTVTAGASIASGAATGVLVGSASSFVADGFKFNWNDQFVATTTGAITGAFGSNGMSKFLSANISNTIFGAPGLLKSLASNTIGGLLASTTEMFETGESWNSAFSFNSITNSLEQSTVSNFAHNGIGGLLGDEDNPNTFIHNNSIINLLSNYFSSATSYSIGNIMAKLPFLNGFGNINASINGMFSGTSSGWLMDMFDPMQ